MTDSTPFLPPLVPRPPPGPPGGGRRRSSEAAGAAEAAAARRHRQSTGVKRPARGPSVPNNRRSKADARDGLSTPTGSERSSLAASTPRARQRQSRRKHKSHRRHEGGRDSMALGAAHASEHSERGSLQGAAPEQPAATGQTEVDRERQLVERRRLASAWEQLRPELRMAAAEAFRRCGDLSVAELFEDKATTQTAVQRWYSPTAEARDNAAIMLQSYWRGCQARWQLRKAAGRSRISDGLCKRMTATAVAVARPLPSAIEATGTGFFPAEQPHQEHLLDWAEQLPTLWLRAVPHAQYVFHQEDIICPPEANPAHRHRQRALSLAAPPQCCAMRGAADVLRRVNALFERAAARVLWARNPLPGPSLEAPPFDQSTTYSDIFYLQDEWEFLRASLDNEERRTRRAIELDLHDTIAARTWELALLTITPSDACQGTLAAFLWTWERLDPQGRRRHLQISTVVRDAAQRHPEAMSAVTNDSLREVVHVLDVFRPLIRRLDFFLGSMRWSPAVSWPRWVWLRIPERAPPALATGTVIPVAAFHSATTNEPPGVECTQPGSNVRVVLLSGAVSVAWASLTPADNEVILPTSRLFEVASRLPLPLCSVLGSPRDVLALRELADDVGKRAKPAGAALAAWRLARAHFQHHAAGYIEPRVRSSAGTAHSVLRTFDDLPPQSTVVVVAPSGTGRTSLLVAVAGRCAAPPRGAAKSTPLFLPLGCENPAVLKEGGLDALAVRTLGVEGRAAREVRSTPMCLLIDGLDDLNPEDPAVRAAMAAIRRRGRRERVEAADPAPESSDSLPPVPLGRAAAVAAPVSTATLSAQQAAASTSSLRGGERENYSLAAHGGVAPAQWPRAATFVTVSPHWLTVAGITAEELCGPAGVVWRTLPLAQADCMRHLASRMKRADSGLGGQQAIGARLAPVAEDPFVCAIAASDGGAALQRVSTEQRLTGGPGRWEACEAALRLLVEKCASHLGAACGTRGALPAGWDSRKIMWLLTMLSIALSIVSCGPGCVPAICALFYSGGGRCGPLACTAAVQGVVREEQEHRGAVRWRELAERALHAAMLSRDLEQRPELLVLHETGVRFEIENQWKEHIEALGLPHAAASTLLPLRREAAWRSGGVDAVCSPQFHAFLCARGMLALPGDDRTATLMRLPPAARAAVIEHLTARLGRDSGPYGKVWKRVARLREGDVALAADAGPLGLTAVVTELRLSSAPGSWEVREAALRRHAEHKLGSGGISEKLPRGWRCVPRVLCYFCRAAAVLFFRCGGSALVAPLWQLLRAGACVGPPDRNSIYADCLEQDATCDAEDEERFGLTLEEEAAREALAGGLAAAVLIGGTVTPAAHLLAAAERAGRQTVADERLRGLQCAMLPLTLLHALPVQWGRPPSWRHAEIADFLIARALFLLPPADRHCLLRYYNWQDCQGTVDLLEDRMARGDEDTRKSRVAAVRWAAARASGRSCAKGNALWTAGARDVSQLRLLATLGADINLTGDARGRTVLHREAHAGRTEDMVLLQSLGADVSAPDRAGATALHEAARWGHAEAVRTLVRLGGDKDARDNLGQTPLHYAARHNHYVVVKLLLRLGAKPCADNDGATPLHRAAVAGHDRMARLLCSVGACDPTLLDSSGRAASVLAAQLGHVQTNAMLKLVEDAYVQGGAKGMADFLESLEPKSEQVNMPRPTRKLSNRRFGGV
eukprot:TRINITY_DN2260_c0_g1_i2.p1 TRINITY_DN2260_c0_g1~~TRINITY_DN2260_c0_g1_i2.p1  ORF type:complete len:1716 (+),score=486.59 TRINITY_DN2260_c0_g1_i2:77-5149(+)